MVVMRVGLTVACLVQLSVVLTDSEMEEMMVGLTEILLDLKRVAESVSKMVDKKAGNLVA